MKVLSRVLMFIAMTQVIDGNNTIQCNRTRVWGPGIDPRNIVMPARYIFLETYDHDGNKILESVEKDVFSVKLQNTVNGCRVRGDLLNRRDGSYVFRYKLYSTCHEPLLSIKCREENLPGFPLHFRGNVHPDDCTCSVNENIEDWFRKYNCTKSFEQINNDLKYFKKLDFDVIFPAAQEKLFKDRSSYSICNYIIKSNQVFRKCYGQYTGFKMFMDAILLFITRKVRLPDVELLVNLGDWPLIKNKVDYSGRKILLPVFSWCGSEESYDITLPTYDLTESSLQNMGRVTLDMLSVQGNSGPRWEEKIPKLFWRGRDSSRERMKLIKIGRQNPGIMNVSLSNMFFFKDLEAEYGPVEERVSFFKFFEYKYQLNVDGTVAAYRFPYLLAGNSLILKQTSSYYEHFYKDLQEWTHYVPVKRDMSDLIEKLEWAINHDVEARKIALNAQHYATENLLPHHIFCYHAHLLYAYSKKQKNRTVEVRPGMELVQQNHNVECQCESRKFAHDLHEDL